MDKQSVWAKWARNLHHWGMGVPAELFLKAVGPVSVVFAQGLVLLKPVINSSPEWDILTETIENADERRLFSQLLHEGNLDE
jgi:hypothetical protein